MAKKPPTWNQNASRRRPTTSSASPTSTSAPPVTIAVIANASPLGWLFTVGMKNSAVMSVAVTNVKKRNENRVIAKETSASAIVTSPMITIDHEPSTNGLKNGSLGNVPISDATP